MSKSGRSSEGRASLLGGGVASLWPIPSPFSPPSCEQDFGSMSLGKRPPHRSSFIQKTPEPQAQLPAPAGSVPFPTLCSSDHVIQATASPCGASDDSAKESCFLQVDTAFLRGPQLCQAEQGVELDFNPRLLLLSVRVCRPKRQCFMQSNKAWEENPQPGPSARFPGQPLFPSPGYSLGWVKAGHSRGGPSSRARTNSREQGKDSRGVP